MKTIHDILQNLAPHAANFNYAGARYMGALIPITGIICAEHGEFQQYAAQLQKIGGAGCPACGAIKRGLARRVTGQQMLQLLIAVHGAKYNFPDLHAAGYKPGTSQRIRAVCAEHGEFYAGYSNLLNGRGCGECGKLTRGKYTGAYEIPPQARVAAIKRDRRLRTLISDFEKVHTNKYDYSKSIYTGMRKLLCITCPAHGEFWQAPHKHLQAGQGCPKCSHRISKPETEVAEYLRSLGAAVEIQNRTIIAPAELDIYLPELKIAVEFNGAHWHADDQNRQHTCDTKRKACLAVGVRLISIFDFEWEKSQNAVKATLRAAIGKQKVVGAREATLAEITAADARTFLNEWHVAKFVGARLYLGAFHKEALVGVASFGASRFKAGEFELLRYATSCHLVGGLPKFVKHAHKTLDFKELTSYCDLRYGTGKSYEGAGFKYQGDTPPDYWWFKGPKYYTRYAVQKHKLAINPDFSEFYSADKTERQIMEDAGFRRISGTGHSKWLFTPRAGSVV